MIFEHSHMSHRLIGSLEEGEELVEVLTTLCKKHNVKAAEIRAVGSFQNVELVRFDRRSKQYVEVVNGAGEFELINLQGNVSTMGEEIVLRLDGLLSVQGLLGQQLIAGQLRSATAVNCEFVIDVFSDLRISRRLDAQRGLLVLDSIAREQPPEAPAPAASAPVSTPAPAAPVYTEPAAPTAAPAAASAPVSAHATQAAAPAPAAAPASSGMSWSDAIAKSDESRPAPRQAPRIGERRPVVPPTLNFDDDDEEQVMSPGDILDHPKLRRCVVMKVEDDDYAHIRLPSGKIRKLALAVCEIVYKGEEDGRKVFQVRVRK